MAGDRRVSHASELLGFDPDARVLIVNCDDLGMSRAIDAGIVQAIEAGIASSCSLMARGPCAAEAIGLLRERPEMRFGVHLTLVDDEGGQPADADLPRLLEQARPDAIERELRAQIEVVLGAGLAPTHLDWHSLLDGGRPDVMEATVRLGLEYGLAVRAWSGPARSALRARGLPAVDHEFLDSFRLERDGKLEHYLRLLRELPAGLTEWAVHPALGGDEWVRSSDYEFLVSAQAAEAVRREGIHVIDYAALQALWRGAQLS
jgi:predicted glycoside hydrolase/deacetylase ChbG (UPF0249 family)